MILNEDYFDDTEELDIDDKELPEMEDEETPHMTLEIISEENILYPRENKRFIKKVKELPFVKSIDIIEERDHNFTFRINQNYELKDAFRDAKQFVMIFMFIGQMYNDNNIMLKCPDYIFEDFIDAIMHYVKEWNKTKNAELIPFYYADDVLCCIRTFAEVLELPFAPYTLEKTVYRIT